MPPRLFFSVNYFHDSIIITKDLLISCINILHTHQLLDPRGLDALYGRMIDRIPKPEDAELCNQILAIVWLVCLSVALDKFPALVEILVGEAEMGVRSSSLSPKILY